MILAIVFEGLQVNWAIMQSLKAWKKNSGLQRDLNPWPPRLFILYLFIYLFYLLFIYLIRQYGG